MRLNKFGIRGLKLVQLGARPVYVWTLPKSLQKLGLFKHRYLGAVFEDAFIKAKEWNAKLESYYVTRDGIKSALSAIDLGTVGHLVRQFEASPRFARYSMRTQQDYSWMYRAVECQIVQGARMFGETKASEVTRQIAYSLYEANVKMRGHDSANKAMGAWSSAFRYGMLRFSEIKLNPFADLDKMSSSPRRQQWTDQQLSVFMKTASDLGHPSIARCALLCMELMQRPGDILDLRWGAYQECERVWHIQQSKRGAIVRIPETRRLRIVLDPARRKLKKLYSSQDREMLVCGTVTGKRWHRRNFTKAVRHIARTAGLPDDLQIRDLRRTAATEGASAGATPAEMMAIGGWTNQASIRPYLVQTREQAAAFQIKRDEYRGSPSAWSNAKNKASF
jgi:integrase